MSTVIDQQGGDMTERARGGRGVLVAGVALGAVVLGGGVYAATAFMGGGGDQPDSVLPASAAVYLRVDMDPSAGQKVAAVRFFQGLDSDTKARLDEGEWREWVWEKLQEDEEIPGDLDFATDVEPWLGDRAGMALVPRGDDQEPIVAFALQVKDGDKALETLDRLTAENDGADDVAYYLADDYVVLTEPDTLDDLKAAAEQGTLDEHEAYTSDMDDLGDQGIASMWVDVSRMGDLAAVMDDAALGAPGLIDEMGPEADLLTGRTAAALRLSPDAIEVHGLSLAPDGMTLPTGGDPARLIEDLPADTAAALSLENGAAVVQATWDFYAQAFPEEVAELTTEAADYGFTLPDDIKTVVGDSMTLAVGPTIVESFMTMSETSTELPALPIGYRADTDAAAVTTLLSDLGMPPSMLAQRTDDGVLTLGLHQPYVDGLAAPSSRLGDDALYKAAVGDAGKADNVFYINVAPFEPDYLPLVEDEDARAALETLAAVGMSGVYESDNRSRFTLRFVADSE